MWMPLVTPPENSVWQRRFRNANVHEPIFQNLPKSSKTVLLGDSCYTRIGQYRGIGLVPNLVAKNAMVSLTMSKMIRFNTYIRLESAVSASASGFVRWRVKILVWRSHSSALCIATFHPLTLQPSLCWLRNTWSCSSGRSSLCRLSEVWNSESKGFYYVLLSKSASVPFRWDHWEKDFRFFHRFNEANIAQVLHMAYPFHLQGIGLADCPLDLLTYPPFIPKKITAKSSKSPSNGEPFPLQLPRHLWSPPDQRNVAAVGRSSASVGPTGLSAPRAALGSPRWANVTPVHLLLRSNWSSIGSDLISMFQQKNLGLNQLPLMTAKMVSKLKKTKNVGEKTGRYTTILWIKC